MITPIDVLALEVKRTADRMFPDRTDSSMFLKMYEEMGEVIGDPEDSSEVADLFILLLDFAKRKGIDIEAEVRKKLAILEQRAWKLHPGTNVYHHVTRD